MPITIREVADDELFALLCLYARLHPEEEMLPLGEAVPLWKALRQDSNQHCLGAYWNGSLVATCTLIVVPNLTRGGRPYGLIENVVTHPDYRRRGLGTAVLKRALQTAWERDCYKVMLLTGSKMRQPSIFMSRPALSAVSRPALSRGPLPPLRTARKVLRTGQSSRNITLWRKRA